MSQKVIDSDWHHGFYLDDFTKTGIFPTNSVLKVYLKSSTSLIDQPNLKENINSSSDGYVNEHSFDKNKSKNEYNNVFSRYQYNIDEVKAFDTPKQARVLYTFSRESDNDQIKYLKLETGDYILVIGNFDENWILCENFKNEKGLFPVNYIEYIDG